MNWYNYFLTSKNSKLTDGHLKSEELYQKILDHDGSTAYCCYFDLDHNYLKLEWDTGKTDKENKKIYHYHLSGQAPNNPTHTCNGKTFTQYEGICRPALGMVSFDFDDEENPENSLNDVRKFVEWLGVDDLAIFFSGSKGFHVMVPFGYFPLEPNTHLPNQLKDLAKHLEETYPTLDTSIYNYNRKFRVPFTKHEKTGLYKCFIKSEDIFDLSVDDIKNELAQLSHSDISFNFLADQKEGEPLHQIIEAIEESKRKSYEIEKDRAGNLEKPSPFEAFDNKLCIQKMLESRCEDIGRNNAAMRLVNDFYRTGKTQSAAEKLMMKWASENDLPLSEVTTIINNIYERGANYNFGCQDECKSLYCSAKCDIWKKLDPEKRPTTVDMPANANLVGEMRLIKSVMEEVFKCWWDENTAEFSGGLICKQGREDLFIYKDKYWQHLDEAMIDKLKRKINQISGGYLNHRKIEAAYKLLLTYVPSAPRDMFTPLSTAAAFRNGTLHLLETSDGKFYLDFKVGHEVTDYLTTKFDFDYTDSEEENEMFSDMCHRIFEGDTHKKDKINAISEMYGAALMPYFPHLFFMCGKASSGKSTFMMILNEMLNSEEHICSVQPKDWTSFGMEPMIGKLVNIVTDINTKRPIEDDVVKQIEDRMPITVDRKGKQKVRVPLPALHLFAGNDFMPSHDGSSHAMERRWTIIRFNNTHKGKKMRNFSHVCYQSNPQGVVNFALKGLKRLVANQGYFTQFESSKEESKTWALESDVVGQFIEEISLNEVPELSIMEGGKIPRKELYRVFKDWQDDSGYKFNLISNRSLYKAMRLKGFVEGWVGSTPAFLGVALSDDSVNNSDACSDKI